MDRTGKYPCQCCGKYTASTRIAFGSDDGFASQVVGSDCLRKIKKAGAEGVLTNGPGSLRLFATKEQAMAAT